MQIDVDFHARRLQRSFDEIAAKMPSKYGQITLQHREENFNSEDGIGHINYKGDVKTDYDFRVWFEEIQSSYIVNCLTSLPFPVVRTRIMSISPKSCYTMHRDKTMRLHIPIISANYAGRFIFDSCDELPNGEVMTLNEGSCWIVNTTLPHTAINCDPTLSRVHIVACLPERHESDNKSLHNIYDHFGM